MTSIVQEWVTHLGLRHQGILMAGVRGCDVLPKEHPCKLLTRFYRSCVLNAHCGDPAKAKSFMVWLESPENYDLGKRVLSDFDNFPYHFVVHMLHSAEVLGYYHPDVEVATFWGWYYQSLVHKMHLNFESKEQLDARLSPDEETFGRMQSALPGVEAVDLGREYA